MPTVPQLPKAIFDSLDQAAQVSIRYLEELVREPLARILKLEERVCDLKNRYYIVLHAPLSCENCNADWVGTEVVDIKNSYVEFSCVC